MFAFLQLPLNAQGLQTRYEPEISAPNAVVMEKETGTVIFDKNSREPGFPASITKIMTMLLITEDIEAGLIKPDDIVTASERAASFGGSCVYLEQGERMSVSEMLKCISVVSANDCAVAMAEHICGSEEGFVRRMNERAKELGMENTHFSNCTGLFQNDGHYTTAYDVALMARELIGHELIKQYTTIWMDSIRDGEFELTNTNKLVYSYPGCTGLKTGYTSTAQYCLAATAERDGVEYIAVVMHAESSEKRNADAKRLLDYAFANYCLRDIDSLFVLNAPAVDLGKAERVRVKCAEGKKLLLPVRGGEPECRVELPERIAAPVKKGEVLGLVKVMQSGEEYTRLMLVAEDDVPRLGYFGIFALIGRSLLAI